MTSEKRNAAELKSRTRKELAQLAKRSRISGWHGMKKDELVRALLSRVRNERRQERNRQRSKLSGATNGHGSRNGGISHDQPRNANGRTLDLSNGSRAGKRPERDFVEATADDAYWIHVCWSFTKGTIRRAEAALGIDWHRAIPVIRLFDVTTGDAEGPDCQRLLCDIEIHGDIDHWHIPVDRPARSYKLHIGYRSPDGKFHTIGKSRVVRMPRAGVNGIVDRTWKRDTKPARSNGRKKNNNGHASNGNAIDPHDFPFRVDAELIVHGETHPQAELTLLGEPVTISKEGRFSLRFALPNGRQVIPAVTVTPSGKEQHTIVLAVERNTRELDPQRMDEML